MTDTIQKRQQQHYFAADGNYGDAEGIIILDTSDWPEDYWPYFGQMSDDGRYQIAQRISLGYGSIDQQDCPFDDMIDGDDEECGFVGPVYRHFEYPERGESGGYTWDCPECGSENSYEGEG